MLKPFVLTCLLSALVLTSLAQDSLPLFSVKNRSGKVIVGWTNPFKDLVLINIQRSSDSLSGFKTILGVADPKAVTNGYLDTKATDTRQFYRLFVQRDAGIYFFTTSRRPQLDTSKAIATPLTTQTPENGSTPVTQGKIASNGPQKKLSGSMSLNADSAKAEAPNAEKIFTPSVFVYTNPQGHVILALPTDKSQAYTLKFYTEDGIPLFTMNKIQESYLTIDKTNFIRSGWFHFELYQNNQMKEKHKLFIPRER